MGTLTIRNLDDALKRRLRQRAARRGVSMEQEVRTELCNALDKPAQTASSPSGRADDKWRLKATAEEILALGRKPDKPFDQKRAFDDLYAYLDDK